MAIFLISSLVPSSSFPLVIHETPPDVIQVYWENQNFEYVDYFELSIKNMSSSDDDTNGNIVILTNIPGMVSKKN